MTVEGILITGQSLAEGGCGGEPVAQVRTPSFPDNVFMLSPQPVGVAWRALGNELVPLIEASRVTVGHSLTYCLSSVELPRNPDYQIVLSGQAWGGRPYRDLAKGGSTRIFELQMDQVKAIAGQRPSIVYRGVVCIHGEQDGVENNEAYAENLMTWQRDLNQAIVGITGQKEIVPLFICQTSSSTGYWIHGGILDNRFQTPLAQLAAHEQHPDIHLVCPKYHLRYHDHGHLTNGATRQLGEHYAKAFRAVRDNGAWSPLRPHGLTVRDRQVVIDFCGNEGQLVFDTEHVKAAEHFGFSYADNASRSIVSVSITGPAQVTLELDGPAAEGAIVAYAYHNGDGGGPAQATGLGDRGNLRDSSPEKSLYDEAPLYNWCVIFRKSVL